MSHTKKVCIGLSNDLLNEIDRYKRSAKKQSRSVAISDLLNYALTFPPYFMEYNWEEAEEEADNAIQQGDIISFDTIEEFIADLKS